MDPRPKQPAETRTDPTPDTAQPAAASMPAVPAPQPAAPLPNEESEVAATDLMPGPPTTGGDSDTDPGTSTSAPAYPM